MPKIDGREVTAKKAKKIRDWKTKYDTAKDGLGPAVKKPKDCKTTELHARTISGKKFNYAGPGTCFSLRQKRGDKPLNYLDACAEKHDAVYNKKDATRAEIQASDDKIVRCIRDAPKFNIGDVANAKIIKAVFAGKRKLEDWKLLDPAKLTDSKDYQSWMKKNYGVKAVGKEAIKKRLIKYAKKVILEKGKEYFIDKNPKIAALYYGSKGLIEGSKKVKKYYDKGKKVKEFLDDTQDYKGKDGTKEPKKEKKKEPKSSNRKSKSAEERRWDEQHINEFAHSQTNSRYGIEEVKQNALSENNNDITLEGRTGAGIVRQDLPQRQRRAHGAYRYAL